MGNSFNRDLKEGKERFPCMSRWKVFQGDGIAHTKDWSRGSLRNSMLRAGWLRGTGSTCMWGAKVGPGHADLFSTIFQVDGKPLEKSELRRENEEMNGP